MSTRNIRTGLALAVLLGNLGGCRKKPPPAAPSAPGPATTSPTTAPSNSTAEGPSHPVSRPAPILPSVAAARKALTRQIFRRIVWKATSHPATGEAIPQAPTELQRHVAAGKQALARSDATAAAECFYRALDIDPAHPDALRGVATALAALGRYRQAVPVYRMIHRIAPKDTVALYNLAVALSKTHQFTKASQAYRQLLARDADDVRSRYNLAVLYQAQGKLEDARRAWQEVVAREPRLASAHTALAEVLVDLADPQGAMLAYAEAAKLRPELVTGWLNLATAAEGAGSYGRAIVATKRAVKLSPDNAVIWARLGELYLALHRATEKDRFLADAVAAWRRSLELNAEQPKLRRYVQTYGSAVAGDDRPNRDN